MWQCAACLAALFATVSGNLPSVLSAQAPPTFRSRVQTVEVDVRVTDRDGRAVRDLTVDDFVILQNGEPQSIDTFSFVDLETTSPIVRQTHDAIAPDVVSNTGEGRMWVLLVNGFGNRTRLVVRSFIESALGPHDEVAVVHALGNMSDAQGFTRNRTLLLNAADRIKTSPSNAGADAMMTAYQVLEDLSLRLGAFRGRRKAIVFFDPPAFFAPSGSQGSGSNPREQMWFLQQRDALRAATRNNVTIYVVSTRGLTPELTGPGQQGSSFDTLRNDAGQRLLAEETGGDALVNSNNYVPAFERFVRDTSTYYVLGYTPPVDEPDGSFHEITVRVRRPGVTVRARRGYYAERPRPESSASPSGPSSGILEALRLPLAMGGISIDLFAAPFRASGRSGQVLLGAQLNGSALVLGAQEQMELGYQAMTPEGRLTSGTTRQILLNLSEDNRKRVESNGLRVIESITLPRGRHQVRFAVHQPNGKTGMVLADVDVPDFENDTVSMSGVLIASQQRPADQHSVVGDAAFEQRFPIKPTAVRRFSNRDVLTAYAEVYTNSKTRMETVNVRATLGRPGDKAPREIAPRIIAGEPRLTSYTVDLALADLPAGQHVLTLEARTGKRTVSRQVLFTIGGP